MAGGAVLLGVDGISIIAHGRSSVLITGENGTGKEVVARTIHYHGARTEKPFIPINCTAIPEGLLDVASSNQAFARVLLVIGVVAVIGFVFGVVKSAVKWMLYSAIVGVAAWYFFFQQ